MPDPERLLIFLDVVECDGFTAAAKKRGLSKASVSKQISLLEAECGVQLLTRSTRSLQLTPVGEQVYQEAQRLSNSFKEIQSIIKGHKKTPQGLLKVFAGRHYGERYLIPRIGDWTGRYPAVTLDLELGERIPNLDKEALDLTIGLSIPGPPASIQKKVATTRYLLCASPDYLRKFGTPTKIADLQHHRYLAHSMRHPNYLIRLGHREVVLKPFLYVNDVEALKSLALQHLGLVWVHEYVIHDEIASGALVALFPELTSKADIPLYLCYKETKFVPAKVRAFIDFFQEGAGD